MSEDSHVDQEARIALFDNFASRLQYWGAHLVALSIAFLAVLQVKEVLCSLDSLFLLVVVEILFQAIYAMSRVVFYGGLMWRVLYVSPTQEHGYSLLYRLHVAANHELEKVWFGKVVCHLSGIVGWFSWSLVGIVIWMSLVLVKIPFPVKIC